MFYVLLGFLLIRVGVGLLNLILPPRLKRQELKELPTVSILIPARNEAVNLPHLFSQILGLHYPKLEVIVLNDQSEDATEAILKQYTQAHPEIHYINGQPLPQGWLGKNWACHQLGERATGDYFLYLDADIHRLDPAIIPTTVHYMQRLGTSLISIFPNQIMQTSGEKWTVPIMHYLLLSLLPLWWIYRLPFPSMAAANGQFMLFKAEDYRQQKWHEQVKSVIVEDIAIMQKIKTAKLKGMTFVGSGLIFCRMYQSLDEGIQGFSKNILSGFGNSMIGLCVYLVLIILGWAWVIPQLTVLEAGLSLGLILALRVMISYLAQQDILENMIFHPIQMALMVWIGGLSIYKKFRGKNEWKGRNVQLPQP
ncbi:MAG: glycosyltransferase family 2 protein [Bacteroidota bacterium]